ncbi:FG-GAP repeat domain-containing protein [Myxococcus landrumensis]|uniref:VCBS repeat-containing protein n=1 Tax=Myxococcus landrumensis TaxID=2813577 RepID=A0ABX7N626_9BACT|nr:VCBS repeat-containing protein [Myxococcus landrumus]QSQ14190.1 VCBS repeat-containing protein [Myxococcus landrumus]
MRESGLSVLSAVATLLAFAGADAAPGSFVVDSSDGAASALAGFSRWSIDMGWCTHQGAQLFSADFNGDGRSDLLCHDSRVGNGDKFIAFARPGGRFVGTDWYRALGWCHHAGSQLHVGDFNGDGRADLLCHDTGNGDKWIAFARPDGTFVGTDWYQAMGWCSHSSGRLSVADYNGDGRSDMLCHDVSSGTKWFAYSTF